MVNLLPRRDLCETPLWPFPGVHGSEKSLHPLTPFLELTVYYTHFHHVIIAFRLDTVWICYLFTCVSEVFGFITYHCRFLLSELQRVVCVAWDQEDGAPPEEPQRIYIWSSLLSVVGITGLGGGSKHLIMYPLRWCAEWSVSPSAGLESSPTHSGQSLTSFE